MSSPKESHAATRGGVLYHLAKFPIVHKLARASGIYPALNAMLGAVPRKRRLAGSGAVYRVKSVAGFALEEEIFKNRSYAAALHGIQVRTFVDLGCNVGWFPVFLRDYLGSQDFSGLLVDADPAVVAEATWHLEANGLDHCQALLGLAGLAPEAPEGDFFVNPANTQSSAKAFDANHPFPVKGKVSAIRVPRLDLAAEWKKLAGEALVDVMKIDIEGMEVEFIRNESVFLSTRVRRVVCEWHKWHVTLGDVQSALAEQGFRYLATTEEDDHGGVAVFEK